MYSLHRFLVDYDMAMLRTLAQSRGVALTTNRQTEAADQLAAALLDPLSVRTALTRLSPAGREALDALLAAGGRMRAPQFARRFGQVRPIGPGRLQREAPWQDPANPAEELWYAGLIFRAFYQDEYGPVEFVFIPSDLQPLLPQPQTQPPIFAVETVAVPAHPGHDGQALVYDLFDYLVYLQNHDVRPYADGRLGRRDMAALRERLANPDERRLIFLRHLAERLEFVTRQSEHLRLEAGPVRRWLKAAPARQLAALQETWRDDPTWNDLCHVPALICDQKTPWHLRYNPVAVRGALLALLSRCPPRGTWWSLASFVAAVKETHPDFQRPDGDYASWYIRDAASGAYLSGFESWDRVEGALIADLLTGTLHWLGVVAVAANGSDAVCGLTEAGMRFLGLVSGEPEVSPPPPIVIHPDFSIEVPASASLYIRFQLERFTDPWGLSGSAELTQVQPEKDLESLAPRRYRLTVEGLGRVLSHGIRVEQVLAFLHQASGAPIPPNVARQLRLWAGRFGVVDKAS
jgi:hypothetical protein